MLAFNIEPVFKVRGIERPYSFLVKAGLSAHSATGILNGTTRTKRLDHVELLCKIPVCEPGDLLLWRGEAGEHIADNHPLNRLKARERAEDLQAALQQMPYRELKEAAKGISGKDKPPG
jgi:hypothetical protein